MEKPDQLSEESTLTTAPNWIQRVTMNISGSMPIDDGGISLRIVNLLQNFPSAIPIDFLAKELGRRPETLADDLSSLEVRGVVKIDRERQTIGLTEAKSSVLSTFLHRLSGTL